MGKGRVWVLGWPSHLVPGPRQWCWPVAGLGVESPLLAPVSALETDHRSAPMVLGVRNGPSGLFYRQEQEAGRGHALLGSEGCSQARAYICWAAGPLPQVGQGAGGSVLGVHPRLAFATHRTDLP